MTKAELIAALADFPDETQVCVWEGGDDGYFTNDIAVYVNGDSVFIDAK